MRRHLQSLLMTLRAKKRRVFKVRTGRLVDGQLKLYPYPKVIMKESVPWSSLKDLLKGYFSLSLTRNYWQEVLQILKMTNVILLMLWSKQIWPACPPCRYQAITFLSSVRFRMVSAAMLSLQWFSALAMVLNALGKWAIQITLRLNQTSPKISIRSANSKTTLSLRTCLIRAQRLAWQRKRLICSTKHCCLTFNKVPRWKLRVKSSRSIFWSEL